jgi:hypothetical protein
MPTNFGLNSLKVNKVDNSVCARREKAPVIFVGKTKEFLMSPTYTNPQLQVIM